MAKLGRIAFVKRDNDGGVVERRCAQRTPADYPVKLKVPSVDSAVQSKLVNISSGGMFLATRNPPPIGTIIDIEVALPDGKLLMHAKGEVVRHDDNIDPPGVGIEFTEISYEAQELIDRLIERSE